MEPAVTLGDLAICSACAETIAVNDAGHQKAAYADVRGLSEADFKILRPARAKVLQKKSR